MVNTPFRGLQTHGIHRLKKTWSNVGSEYHAHLAEAQAISKESNHADDSIPYLGHVLTDLMMVDAAYPDRLEDSGRLINFEKRRKEFELLKMIISMQKTLLDAQEKPKARLSASFVTWVSFIQPLTESQSFELSQMVESNISKEQDSKPHGNVLEHSFSALLHEPEKFEEHVSDCSDIEEIEENLQYESLRLKRTQTVKTVIPLEPQPVSTCQADQQGEYLIARVTVEDGASALTTGINYRTIIIREGDRVRNIIDNALQKYALQDKNTDKWKLVQKTDNDELVFAANSSMYHAVSGYKGEQGCSVIFGGLCR